MSSHAMLEDIFSCGCPQMLQYNDSFCCSISNPNSSSVYWLIHMHSMATILWMGSMSCGGTRSKDTLLRHKYGHIWQCHVFHPLHREVSLPSPVRYVMFTSAGASGGIKRGGNPVRVSANGCPSEQDNVAHPLNKLLQPVRSRIVPKLLLEHTSMFHRNHGH